MYAYLKLDTSLPLKHQGLGTGHCLCGKGYDGLLKVQILTKLGELILPFHWPETAPDIVGWHEHARYTPSDRELYARWTAFQTEGCWQMENVSTWDVLWVNDPAGTHVLWHRGKAVRVSPLERNCAFRFWESMINLLHAGSSSPVWEPPPLIPGETERCGFEARYWENRFPFNTRYWGDRRIFFCIHPAPMGALSGWPDFSWRVPIGFAWRGHGGHDLPEDGLANHIATIESQFTCRPLV